MNDDAALLRRYAEEGSHEAFTELVRRHVDLVYAAGLRRTHGNAQLAADVSQHVFISLARQASRLEPNTVLAAWLHTATRNAALNLMISEHRRRVRETDAVSMEAAHESGELPPNWEELRPLLDAAVDELPELDRASLILRFFECRPFKEIAAALRVSEDAARMRTERALEKLRVALGRRGLRSSAAVLAVVVSSQPLISAPVGLAATLAAQSLAAAGASLATGGLLAFMKVKIITTAAASAVIAFLIGGYAGHNRGAATVPPPSSDVPRLEQTVVALRHDNRQLQDEVAALRADVTTLKDANATLAEQAAAARTVAPAPATRKSPTIGLARYEVQQGVLNNLRQIAAARDQFRLERGRAPESVHALVGPPATKAFIRTLRTVGGEDYSDLQLDGSGPLSVTTPDGIAVTYDPSGVLTTKPEVPPEVARAHELSRRTKPAIDKAVEAFRAANNGSHPANEQALLPYFATPQEGADFVELVEARKAAGM